jgi:aminopeptidase
MLDLRSLAFDPDYTAGARSAIRTCLRLKPEERVTIITDTHTADIASSVLHEVDAVGSPSSVFVLEDLARRPLQEMPRVILEDLARSRVSVFAAQGQQGELHARMQVFEVVTRHRIRHAHMVNISAQIMREGMRADHLAIDRLSSALLKKARSSRLLRATTPAGTRLEVEFSPSLHWIKTSGIISEDEWGNLPGGEIFTCPLHVNGVFVVDGVVGDYLGAKYGDLKESPLAITIANSRIVDLACEHRQLLEDFRTYTHADPNSDRVGEVGVGTNTAIRRLIGQILQDEKYPGLHMAFGHPAGERTGADWTASTHIDCVGRGFSIWMDGEQVMTEGVFADAYLSAAGPEGDSRPATT